MFHIDPSFSNILSSTTVLRQKKNHTRIGMVLFGFGGDAQTRTLFPRRKPHVKGALARGMMLGLEFMMVAEILKTIVIRDSALPLGYVAASEKLCFIPLPPVAKAPYPQSLSSCSPKSKLDFEGPLFPMEKRF